MDNNKPERDLLKELGYRLLSEGKILRIRADGYSMYPQIKPGSFLLIEPLKDVSVLTEKDIVAWKRKSGMVVHRLVRIEESGNIKKFITRGDSCRREDEPLERELIIGRVKGIFTGVKFEKRNPVYRGDIMYLKNNLTVKLLLVRDKIRRIFDY